MKRLPPSLFALLLWLSCLPAAHAQEWLDFRGQFTLVGELPKRKELMVSEKEKLAVGLPADHKFYDESLLIHEKNKGIANVLVWCIPDPDKPDSKMPIHSSYEETKASEHHIKLKNLMFAPPISVMRTGQTLVMTGEDRVGHNGAFVSGNASYSGLAFPGNYPHQIKHLKEMRAPTPMSCSIHPHEKAYLLVRDNPYFAVTNDQGVFEIKNVPKGEWRFKAWHERIGYITNVKLGPLKHSWPKGEFKVKFEKFDAFLGAVEIDAKEFEKK